MSDGKGPGVGMFLSGCAGIIVVCLLAGALRLSGSMSFGRAKTHSVTVCAGQVWVYVGEDPFDPWTQTNTVLAVQDGYVQYKSNTGRTNSWGVHTFLYGSTLISPPGIAECLE